MSCYVESVEMVPKYGKIELRNSFGAKTERSISRQNDISAFHKSPINQTVSKIHQILSIDNVVHLFYIVSTVY